MKNSKRRSLPVAIVMILLPSAATYADADDSKHARAAEFANCAAYYFNAVNVTPVKEYEAVYGQGELAFNEAIKLVGRKQVDASMAQASNEMMKFMASNWKNFPSVEKRYAEKCNMLMASVPAQ